MKISKKLHKQQVRSKQKEFKKQQEKDKKLKLKMKQENKQQFSETNNKETNNTITSIAEEKQEQPRQQDFEESTTFIPNALGKIFLNAAYLYKAFEGTPETPTLTKHEKIDEICNKSKTKKEKDEIIIDAEFTEIEK